MNIEQLEAIEKKYEPLIISILEDIKSHLSGCGFPLGEVENESDEELEWVFAVNDCAAIAIRIKENRWASDPYIYGPDGINFVLSAYDMSGHRFYRKRVDTPMWVSTDGDISERFAAFAKMVSDDMENLITQVVEKVR